MIRYHGRLVYFVAILVLVGLSGCNREATPAKPATPRQTLTVCQGGILTVLPIIAREKGFFAAEGLDVSINLIGDGKATMGALLDGTCDLALTGEFPVVRQSFERHDLAVIATTASSDNAVKILVRRDRGITTPAGLVGKRVGVSKGTISNFFLDQFLKKNRIPKEALTIVDMSHQDLPAALQRGDLDAYAGSDVAYLKGKKLMGTAAVITFSEPGLTNHAACLVAKKEWVAAQQKTARGLLRALLQAEQELARQPEELTTLLATQLNTPREELKSLLAEQNSKVTLDQVLLLALEDEARWMQETGIVTGKTMPNFLRVLDPTLLKGVNPETVRLK